MLRSKFIKLLSFLKQQISFFSNFASIFSVIRHNSSAFFLAEILYTFNKKPIKLQIWWNWKSKIWHFDGLLSSKYYKELSLMTLRSDAKFKEKLTCSFKYNTRNFVNFHPTSQKSVDFTAMSYFCLKYMRFELKKYRGIIFHDTEQWCKMWINPDILVSKMAWGIGWTFIRALKSLKNYTLMGSFCSKHMFQLENFKGIMYHETEGWSKKSWFVAWKKSELKIKKFALWWDSFVQSI